MPSTLRPVQSSQHRLRCSFFLILLLACLIPLEILGLAPAGFAQTSFAQTSFAQTSFAQTSFAQTSFAQTSFAQTSFAQTSSLSVSPVANTQVKIVGAEAKAFAHSPLGATAPRTTTTSGVSAPAFTHSAISAASGPRSTATSLASSGSAYGGTVFNGPHILPGKFQCEDYDQGGEGIAYHDADPGNNGGAYRSEDVDIEGCGDTDGGYDVGWTGAGEWLGYSVQVQNAGTYSVSIRASSPSGGGGLHLEDESGTNLTGPITIPATGSWQSYTTVTASATLTAGLHVLRLVEDSGGYNLNWITFSALSSPTRVLAINANGTAIPPFTADAFYSGGNGAATGAVIDTSGIADPAPQSVYQTERWGNFTYTLPGLTPGGVYTLRLHFAELYYGPGQRQFNVSVNSTQVLTNFDIAASAGGANKAVVQSFSATADASGQIVVQFTNGAADNAKVDGLEVFTGTFVPAISRITLLPGSATLNLNGTQQFTATARDQNGSVLSPQPAFTWSVASGGVGTVNASGLYSAGAASGSATVRAASGGVSATATATVSTPPQPTPYGGSAVTISSSGTAKIEAENYDLGGEGVAFHDLANGGQTLYRTDNIGLYTDSRFSNGFCVGNTANGEWDGYTLNVSAAGAYTLAVAVGSPASGGTFHLEFGPIGQIGGAGVVQSGPFTVPNTGSYSTFQLVSAPGISLPAGPLWMRLVVDSADPCTFDYFTLSAPAPVLTSIAVSPATTTLNTGGTQQFTAVAKDQDGSSLSPQPAFTWSVPTAHGTISGAGLYTAPAAAGSDTVQVASGGVRATATVTASAVGFLVSASASQLGTAPTGSASTALTLTSFGGFSGSVVFSLSGLPSGASNSFTPASSVSVSAGEAVANTLTVKTYSVAPGAYPLMLVATSGTLSHSVPLTLTVAPGPSTNAVRLTDAYLSGDGILTHRIEWDGPAISVSYAGPGSVYNVIITGYSVSRTGGTGTSAGTFTSGDTPSWIDGPPFANPQAQSSQQLQFGTPYTYTVKANYAYTVNGDPNQSGGSGIVTVGYCQVTSVRAAVADDQAVDSRLDPRYSTNIYLDHNFGATSYRGGLFAGYNADPARIGRSLLKFSLPALPAGQNLWRSGNICAYATRGFAAGTATVYCQRIGDGWTGQTAVWSLAPSLPAVPSPLTGIPTVPITYDGSTPINTWQHWKLFPDIFSAMSSGGSLSVALASTDEARPVWIYFAKKEYDATLAPCAVYSYGAPN